MQWLLVSELASKPHHLRAIEIDPDFASAYSALSIVCSNMGQTQEAIQYMQKGYARRERASERERIRIEGNDHNFVTGDKFKGIEAFRAYQLAYPRDSMGFINAADITMELGQWDKAVASSQRAQALEFTSIGVSNLAISLMAVGRHDEARATVEDALARGLDVFYLHLDAYQEAFLRGDTSTMKRHADAVAGKPTEEDYLLAAQADTEAFHGRHTRARELSARAVESARRAGASEMSAVWQAEAALREAEIGEHERARPMCWRAAATVTMRCDSPPSSIATIRSTLPSSSIGWRAFGPRWHSEPRTGRPRSMRSSRLLPSSSASPNPSKAA
jgi:tetratricopeptide (TPR) repeat protein